MEHTPSSSPARRRGLACFLVACWCAVAVRAMEPELRCSACKAVAAELQRRLDTELPRDKLDMRHRLDEKGQRYGKVIDYKVSEVRAVELLEDLCDAMSDYTLSRSSPAPAAAAADRAADSALDSSSSSSSEQQTAAARVWVKHRGEGSVRVPKDARPPKGEEEARIKQLKTFCGLLIENDEESIVEAVMTDQFTAAGVAPVLCHEITKRCLAANAS